MAGIDGLAKLEAALARDFERLNHPPADWVPPRTGPDGRRMADVLIAGAGMCGLAAAFALRRLGVSNLRHVDRSPAGREGPWLTYARMEALRSPKHLTGRCSGSRASPSVHGGRRGETTGRRWGESRGRSGWSTSTGTGGSPGRGSRTRSRSRRSSSGPKTGRPPGGYRDRCRKREGGCSGAARRSGRKGGAPRPSRGSRDRARGAGFPAGAGAARRVRGAGWPPYATAPKTSTSRPSPGAGSRSSASPPLPSTTPPPRSRQGRRRSSSSVAHRGSRGSTR